MDPSELYYFKKELLYFSGRPFIFIALSADGKSEVTVPVGFRKIIQRNIGYLKWNILSNNHVLIPRDIQKEQKHKCMNGL